MSPNILLIMSDNHSAEMLGCHGNAEVHTPRIDQMAADGLKFNQAYCVNAMCSPCRASVLTGLLPSQHGIHTWIDDRTPDKIPAGWNAIDEFKTLPEQLKQNGYDTALIGKYHLGDARQVKNSFDHWVTFPHGHTVNFWGNTIIENGETYQSEGHSVDFFTDKTIDYLEQRQQENSENPFFLFMPLNGPYGHWPCISGQAQHRFGHLYDDCPMTSAPREPLAREAIAKVMWQHQNSGHGLDYSALLRMPNNLETLRNYYSQMTLVDDSVGRVLDSLDQLNLSEDTLVIYTTDHGFSTGAHGYWGHGQATWPANTHAASFHIPIIMHQPGTIPAGQSADPLISQIDLFPTLLDFAGCELPEGKSAAKNLRPLIDKGQSADWDNLILMDQEETRAIRTADWLYMSRFQGNADHPLPNELYDLNADPDERTNLIDSPEHAKTIVELQQQLDNCFDDLADPDWDLWHGGRVKSNSDKPWFWQLAWGENWRPVF